MGLFSGNPIKKATNSIVKTVTDPLRLTGALAGNAALGIGGAGVGSVIGKQLGQMPSEPTFEGLEGAQQLQGNIIGSRIAAAERFKAGLPDYIEGEYGAQKAGIDRNYGDQRKSLLANLNSRGMVKSGQSKLQQGQLQADKAADLVAARGNVVKDAYGQASAYEADPLFSLANVAEAKTRQQSEMDRLAQQRQAASQALMGNAAQSIGSGVGRGAANLNAGRGFGYGGTV